MLRERSARKVEKGARIPGWRSNSVRSAWRCVCYGSVTSTLGVLAATGYFNHIVVAKSESHIANEAIVIAQQTRRDLMCVVMSALLFVAAHGYRTGRGHP
jgi:hypothetical protein